ncbi:MAG: hypothetical protein IH841_00615 [Thaumarchaeota archaeon]|nr:hypothetical protein [Nitrososphaerota archaeon]
MLNFITKQLKSGFGLRAFKLDIMDFGFIILLAMLTYQGHTVQLLCSTSICWR